MIERARWHRPRARQMLLGVLLAQVLAIPAVGWGILLPLVHRSAHDLATSMQLVVAQWHALAPQPAVQQAWAEQLAREHGLQISENATDQVAARPVNRLDIYAWTMAHALASGHVHAVATPSGTLIQWVNRSDAGATVRVMAPPLGLRSAVLALLALQLSGIVGTLLGLRWQSRLALQNRQKTILLGSLAHDLRTPLTRLRLLLDLQDALPGADQAAMQRSVLALQALVDQSLDLFAPPGARAVTTQSWGDWLADQQATWPAVRWEGAAALVAEAPLRHSQTLTRALGNLLDNAFHHGQAPVKVWVQTRGDLLDLVVQDAGSGVPASVWSRIRRQEMPQARGHGMGLLATRWLMQGVGGELTWHRGLLGLRTRLRVPRENKPRSPEDQTI